MRPKQPRERPHRDQHENRPCRAAPPQPANLIPRPRKPMAAPRTELGIPPDRIAARISRTSDAKTRHPLIYRPGGGGDLDDGICRRAMERSRLAQAMVAGQSERSEDDCKRCDEAREISEKRRRMTDRQRATEVNHLDGSVGLAPPTHATAFHPTDSIACNSATVNHSPCGPIVNRSPVVRSARQISSNL